MIFKQIVPYAHIFHGDDGLNVRFQQTFARHVRVEASFALFFWLNAEV